MQRSTVLVFDVNETLLDLGSLRPLFTESFGDAGAMTEWFLRLLHGSLVLTLTGTYEDFGSIAASALRVTARRRSVELDDDRLAEILGSMRRLPPHPEVRDALAHLKEAGFRTAALTNSTLELANDQLRNAELVDLFDTVLSVEEVRRYKPAPEPYRMAAERLGVAIEGVRMVAAHDWDVAGALAAGARGAFVARLGQVYREGLARPDIEGNDLREIAARILTVDHPAEVGR